MNINGHRNEKKSSEQLEEVSINLEVSQKIVKESEGSLEFQIHKKNKSQYYTAQQYDKILNDAIEKVVLFRLQPTFSDFTDLYQLHKLNRHDISFIAAINLQLVQKLQYLCFRIPQVMEDFDVYFLIKERDYWKQFILFMCNQNSEEIEKYAIRSSKSVKSENHKAQSDSNSIKNEDKQVIKSQREQIKQQVKVKQQINAENTKNSKKFKHKSKNRAQQYTPMNDRQQ